MRPFWKAGRRRAARTIAAFAAVLALGAAAAGCGEKSEPAVQAPSTSTAAPVPTNTATTPAPTTPAPTTTKPAQKP